MNNINYLLDKRYEELTNDDINLFMELLINRLMLEFEKRDKSGIYGFMQRFCGYNSNRIEGSTLTAHQTAGLFETGSSFSSDDIYKAKDVEEMQGHFLMFNEMLKSYSMPLSEDLIKKYHYDLKCGVYEDRANGYPIGEYKNRINIVMGMETEHPSSVSDKMKELINEYEEIDNIGIQDIVSFHSKYEKIHPFQDGNGRTGRILILKECLRHGIMPIVVDDSRKGRYYASLNKAQTTGDYSDLVEFFKYEQIEFYKVSKEFLYQY